jgi:hypothetical protein
MCCGITYLVFGVMRCNSSFPSLKPRTLVTAQNTTIRYRKLTSLSKLKRNSILRDGVEKEREREADGLTGLWVYSKLRCTAYSRIKRKEHRLQ